MSKLTPEVAQLGVRMIQWMNMVSKSRRISLDKQ